MAPRAVLFRHFVAAVRPTRQSSTFATKLPTPSRQCEHAMEQLLTYIRAHGHLISKLGVFGADAAIGEQAQKLVNCFPTIFSQPENIDLLQSALEGSGFSINETPLAKWLNDYCGPVGYEFSHLPEVEQEWVAARIESSTAATSKLLQKRFARLMLESEVLRIPLLSRHLTCL